MSGLRTLIALLKPEMYRWRFMFYATGVIWAFLAAAELLGGQWWRALLAIAIGAVYFCLYEKCCTWRNKS